MMKSGLLALILVCGVLLPLSSRGAGTNFPAQCPMGVRLAPASDTNPIPTVSPVAIEFFNEPGYEECAVVAEQIFPELELHYGGITS